MAGLPPFISFSTSYPELNSAVLRHTGKERFVGKPYLTGLCQGCPFLSGVGFRPQSRLGRVSKDRSFESDDLMSWDVRPGLFRDVVPLAHESFLAALASSPP